MAFKNAATVVIAQIFQIIDPNGVIVAQLGNTTGPNASFLQFFHHDAPLVDSQFAWTTSGDPAQLYLFGPNAEDGATGRQLPSIQMTDNSAGTIRRIEINASQLFVRSDAPAFVERGDGASRGLLYGVSFHQTTLAADTNFTLAGTTALTVNLPNAPVAGGFMVISFGGRINIVGATQPTLDLLIDGSGAFVPSWDSGNLPVGEVAACVAGFAYNATVGTHTVQIRLRCTVANNLAVARGSASSVEPLYLTVTYYR